MNSIVTFSSLFSLLKWLALSLQGALWCILAILFYTWITNRKATSAESSQELPSLKTRVGSIYGHIGTLPPASVLKRTSLSFHAYFLQTLSGHAKIFEKEPLFLLKIAIKHFVILTKHETVEELLSSTTLLEKSSIYRLVHPWLGTGLLTSNGTKWKSRRKLLTHSFHFDILKDFVPAFDQQSKVLVGILKRKAHEEWIDIVQLITLCSLDIICETTLGAHIGAQTNSESEYVAAVLRSSTAVMERLRNPLFLSDTIFGLSQLGRQFRKDVECLHNFTRKVIREKKEALKSEGAETKDNGGMEIKGNTQRRRKALMDLLLDVHMNSQEFTENDVREEIDTFVFEGHDTTSMGMSWALFLIGLYPDVQTKLHQELDEIYGDDRERPTTTEDLKEMHYLERVLKESQRLYPSVPVFGRQVNEDICLPVTRVIRGLDKSGTLKGRPTHFRRWNTVIEKQGDCIRGKDRKELMSGIKYTCGYKIRKGSTLVVDTYDLHRNPEVFPNPEKFDPDRFLTENCIGRNPFAYVPFSAGPRNCIGQRFAMMEEKTVIANILRNFRVRSLEERDKIFPKADLTTRSERPLKVKFFHRDNKA